jgi:hypothetical protein
MPDNPDSGQLGRTNANGERVNVNIFQDLLWQNVVPWIQWTYPDSNYIFQQDSAPAQTACS